MMIKFFKKVYMLAFGSTDMSYETAEAFINALVEENKE